MPVRLVKQPNISPVDVKYRADANRLLRDAAAGRLDNADINFVPPRLGTSSFGHWIVRLTGGGPSVTHSHGPQEEQAAPVPATAQDGK